EEVSSHAKVAVRLEAPLSVGKAAEPVALARVPDEPESIERGHLRRGESVVLVRLPLLVEPPTQRVALLIDELSASPVLPIRGVKRAGCREPSLPVLLVGVPDHSESVELEDPVSLERPSLPCLPLPDDPEPQLEPILLMQVRDAGVSDTVHEAFE